MSVTVTAALCVHLQVVLRPPCHKLHPARTAGDCIHKMTTFQRITSASVGFCLSWLVCKCAAEDYVATMVAPGVSSPSTYLWTDSRSAVLDGKLYFSGKDVAGTYGTELWAYDGSTALRCTE